MGNKELRLNYQEAVQLIRVGRFEEALTILKEIDRERPNVKNVLYPMAFCCEKLGYAEEGLDLCEQLIMEYDHEKARAIKARIELSMAIPEAVEVVAGEEPVEAEDDPFLPVETEDQPVPEAALAATDGDVEAVEFKSRHKKPIWLVLLIALVAAAAVAFLLHKYVLNSF